MSERDPLEAGSQHPDESGQKLWPTVGVPPLPEGSVPANLSPVAERIPESIDHTTPVGSSSVDPIDPLPAAVRRISDRLEELTDIVKARLSYDKAKEDAFERLYGDLDKLKKNATQDNIRPLLLDLILLYDRMDQAYRKTSAADGAGGFIGIEVVKSFIDELLEALFRRDVELIDVPSPAFDPSQQRAIGVEVVTDPSQDQHVAMIVRRGFRLDSRVLRPEDVIVQRFVEPDATPAGGDNGSAKTEGDNDAGRTDRQGG